jgi:hypothetical protein
MLYSVQCTFDGDGDGYAHVGVSDEVVGPSADARAAHDVHGVIRHLKLKLKLNLKLGFKKNGFKYVQQLQNIVLMSS